MAILIQQAGLSRATLGKLAGIWLGWARWDWVGLDGVGDGFKLGLGPILVLSLNFSLLCHLESP